MNLKNFWESMLKMKRFIVLILFFTTGGFSSERTRDSLEGVIFKNDKRYSTFREFFLLGAKRKAQILVETGTARSGVSDPVGDGASTYLFAKWCFKNKAHLYSVDIDHRAINRSSACVRRYKDFVTFYVQDSIEFLKNFPGTIDLLYLDSFDFDVNNPYPSQEHHLKEIMAAINKLQDTSVVLIDDCNLPHGGKGKLAIEFLESRGWKIWLKGYQTLLVKDSESDYPQN